MYIAYHRLNATQRLAPRTGLFLFVRAICICDTNNLPINIHVAMLTVKYCRWAYSLNMDGHTESGRWIIKLELSEDQVQQLIRSMEWAKMMDSHSDGDHPLNMHQPEDMQVLAHRVFLQEILTILYAAVKEQRK